MPTVLYFLGEDRYFLTHRRALAEAARARGWKVVVASAPGSCADEIRALGFEYTPVRLKRRGTNPITELPTIFAFAALIRKYRPDLIHNVGLKPVLYGSMAAFIAGRPAVLNAITGLGYVFMTDNRKADLIRRAVEWVLKWVTSRSRSRVIVQNPDDFDLLAKKKIIDTARTDIILGSGVDVKKFAPSPEPTGPVTIVVPTRMLWDKGIKEFVEACRILRRDGVKFSALLAGTPDDNNPTSVSEDVLKGWNAEGVVEWIGYQNDMPALLARSHLVCLPSYREGVPKALIEAAACGRPIVTTDAPGCREIVRDHHNGYLVPVKSVTELADALRKLIEDEALRRQMGQCGRELVLSTFADEIVVQRTLAVYEQLFQPGRRSLIAE